MHRLKCYALQAGSRVVLRRAAVGKAAGLLSDASGGFR